MEDSQGSDSHENEINILHISLGNAENESNGHRNRVGPVELLENMRRMQKQV